jgi:hypothetical protein
MRIDGKSQTVKRLNPDSIPASLDRVNPDPAQAAELGTWQGRPNPDRRPTAPPTLPNYTGVYDSQALLGSRSKDGKNKHGDVLSKLSSVAEEAKPAADAAGAGKGLMERITRCMWV